MSDHLVTPIPKSPKQFLRSSGGKKTLRWRSKKAESKAPERAIVREQCFARDNWTCQAFVRGILTEIKCTPGLECNEIIRRSQWRAGYLVLDNTVSLCPAHHHFVTHHSKIAHAVGLLKWSHERPDIEVDE